MGIFFSVFFKDYICPAADELHLWYSVDPHVGPVGGKFFLGRNGFLRLYPKNYVNRIQGGLKHIAGWQGMFRENSYFSWLGLHFE